MGFKNLWDSCFFITFLSESLGLGGLFGSILLGGINSSFWDLASLRSLLGLAYLRVVLDLGAYLWFDESLKLLSPPFL